MMTETLSVTDQFYSLAHFAKCDIVHAPTRLEHLPRLSAALGGPEIWIKRDDCTGLAFGGNKTRKLEFLIADAQSKGADVLITAGGVQSNHARQTAAAAARFGFDCHLLLENGLGSSEPEYLGNGNALLDRIVGATSEVLPADADMEALIDAAMRRFSDEGRTAYFIPVGGSNAIGALGYVSCAHELINQISQLDTDFDHLVMSTGSAGTQVGLLAGISLAGLNLPVHGMSVSKPREMMKTIVESLLEQTLDLLGHTAHDREKLVLTNSDYVGEGYAIPAASTIEAIELTARTEGILLDPVYTGKGMAGLVDYVRQGRFASDERVIFLHTGGAPGLFAYRQQFQ